MQKSIDDILDLLESVHDDEDVAGVVARFRDQLVSEDGSRALVERLERRRDGLRRWRGVANLIKRIHMQDAADTRHELETATQEVLRAEGAVALGKVAKERPIVFTGTFIHTLIQLQRQAREAGDDQAVELVNNRLKHLQFLQLALIQELEVTRENLRLIVYQVLEARSFADLLDRFSEYPVTFSEAFDEILLELAREGAQSDGDPKLPQVAELRIDVLQGLRRVVETFVHNRPAKGGADDAVAALVRANQADKFFHAVADYPFVLGEDFALILERELERARSEADDKAVAGLERRKQHLDRIGQIVTKLTGDPEELERQAEAQRQERIRSEEAMLKAAGKLPDEADEGGEKAPEEGVE